MGQRGRGGWIGWLIFVLVVFGSRLLPPLAQWLSQVTGLPISPPLLIAAIAILAVIASAGSSAMRQLGKARGANDTRLPTTTTASPPQPTTLSRPSAPPRPVKLPTSTNLQPPRLPSGEQRLPSPPRYDPIIDPRVLAFGIIGLVLLGGFFFVALLLSNITP
jgi:hypothetical protein